MPRGKARKQLLEGNCAKRIEMFRTMSADEVKAKFLCEFTTISTISYLQLNGAVDMAISSQQDLDNNKVITSSLKINGNVVYITDHTMLKQYIFIVGQLQPSPQPAVLCIHIPAPGLVVMILSSQLYSHHS